MVFLWIIQNQIEDQSKGTFLDFVTNWIKNIQTPLETHTVVHRWSSVLLSATKSNVVFNNTESVEATEYSTTEKGNCTICDMHFYAKNGSSKCSTNNIVKTR